MAPPSSVGPLKPLQEGGGAFLLYAVGKVRRQSKKTNEIVYTIRAGNDHLKVVTILSVVRGLGLSDGRAPQSTFVVCSACWVGAVLGVAGAHCRIALDIDIESFTSRCSVTFRGAGQSVVTGESVKPHVIGSTQGCREVRKDLGISIWGHGTGSD